MNKIKFKLDPSNKFHVTLALLTFVLMILVVFGMLYIFTMGTYLTFKASVLLGFAGLVTSYLSKKGIPSISMIIGAIYLITGSDVAPSIVEWLRNL